MVTTYHVTVCTAVRAPPVRVVCCLPPGAAPCSSQACRPGDSLTRARSLLHPGIARQPRGGSRISDGSVESMEAGAADDLAERRSGRRDTLDRIMPIVYEHLRVIARHQLGMREGGGTLSTTGLVHEAYLKLVDQSRVAWSDRAHFFALASVAMRHLLVDRARAQLAGKRDGAMVRVTLDNEQVADESQPEVMLEINDAVDRLAAVEPRLAKVVELRCCGGLSEEETASARDITTL